MFKKAFFKINHFVTSISCSCSEVEEIVELARLLVRNEHLNLIRGSITQTIFEARKSEIIEKYYSLIRPLCRFKLSKKRFLKIVTVEG